MRFSAFVRGVALLCGLGLIPGSQAQAGPFDGGWTLDGAASSIAFQSIKDQTKVELNSFAALEGAIDAGGTATVTVHLESVDTKIDLRNVRMRFLFFETFLYPEATITAQIDPSAIADLAETRRKTIPMPFTLDLHGVTKAYEADVTVTLLDADRVFVNSAQPISIPVADFGMESGLTKLEEAAGLPIIPSATVSFEFAFTRNGATAATPVQLAAAPANRALESSGDFAPEECRNRFQTMSEANEISFASGSTRLQASSAPVLDSLVEIITRCPGLTIGISGHTDNVGSDEANQRLSERRAASVADYLVGKGIPANRFETAGYGETRPIADNATDRGRWRNRRIDFTILGG
ncbi:OmpA family protein [Tropicimonas sp. IMCC6043]|uniref:OmpA family protein n=1 Tax=Tropicimonas sp. IMCC6043 TaxID=2510645 RepID=UPI00101D488D|nr:OmpA family protein [Tropicimonas sp. IMCC6043]RYH10906.1 hypothetical protein EU800_06540 [Tropicimonas sp. IMCC6043]